MICFFFGLDMMFIALLAATDNVIGYVKYLDFDALDIIRAQMVRFAQFNLQPDIQHKFTEEGHHSPRIDVAPPPGLPPLSALELDPIDYDYIEANTRAIKTKFAEIFQ